MLFHRVKAIAQTIRMLSRGRMVAPKRAVLGHGDMGAAVNRRIHRKSWRRKL